MLSHAGRVPVVQHSIRRCTQKIPWIVGANFLVGQLPALRGAALMQERVCFYDRSPDGDFVLDQWDADARLLVACGFSGHGFKFGPLTGARLARYALTGRRPADLAPFGFDRFGSAART